MFMLRCQILYIFDQFCVSDELSCVHELDPRNYGGEECGLHTISCGPQAHVTDWQAFLYESIKADNVSYILSVCWPLRIQRAPSA